MLSEARSKMTARIYRPARNAMQSGKGKSQKWLLVHDPEVARSIDPLMGYTSSEDMHGQIRLSFDTQEEAEAYAKRSGFDFWVQPAHDASIKRTIYSDNFRSDRKVPWTH